MAAQVEMYHFSIVSRTSSRTYKSVDDVSLLPALANKWNSAAQDLAHVRYSNECVGRELGID
jgi:hypothetical protein